MPAFLHESGDQSVKAVCIFPRDAERGHPTIHTLATGFDPRTGISGRGRIDVGPLTPLGTGAASGATADMLARPD